MLIGATKAQVSNVVCVSTCAEYDFSSNKNYLCQLKENILNDYSKSKLYAESIEKNYQGNPEFHI